MMEVEGVADSVLKYLDVEVAMLKDKNGMKALAEQLTTMSQQPQQPPQGGQTNAT